METRLPSTDGEAQTPTPHTLTFENLELRHDEMQALVDGSRVGFTVREFQILAALAGHADRVVRRPEIYRLVWGGEMKHRDRAVDVFVRKVRTKLAAVAPQWTYIHTHFGIGYRFAPEQVPAAQEVDLPVAQEGRVPVAQDGRVPVAQDGRVPVAQGQAEPTLA